MSIPWRVTASKDGTPILTTDLLASEDRYVLFVGDAHWDHARCDRAALKRTLEEAKERNAAIIDIGDLLDVMQGREDRRSSKGALRPEHATDNYFQSVVQDAAKWFEPYAENIAVMLTGNHETAVGKHQEVNLTTWLASELKRAGSPVVYGGYQTYVIFRFVYGKTQHIGIPAWIGHGHGGAAPVTKGVISAQRRAVTYPDARFLVTGHIHQAWSVAHSQLRCNTHGSVTPLEQEHFSVGTFKNEYGDGRSGWAVEKGFAPSVPSALWARFFVRNKQVHWEFTKSR